LKQAAADNGVPRTTAQNWQRNRVRLEQQSGLEPTVVQFFRVTPRARAPT
jgi:cell wall-associated NlpC family hydrolase